MKFISELEPPVLIGVLHLPPLPGSPSYVLLKENDGMVHELVDKLAEYAVREARKLKESGFDAIIIENYGSIPFRRKAERPVLMAMALIAREVRREVEIPVGLSVLRNDPAGAVEASLISGASFIRVNALCSARISPEGVIGPSLYDLARSLASLGAKPNSIEVLADIDVKHSIPLSPKYSPEWEIEECYHRKGPLRVIGLIISGERTGEPPDIEKALRLTKLIRRRGFKAIIGSGVTPENASRYGGFDGYIIGTSIKERPGSGSPFDIDKARTIARILKR